jgi:hypothetical protein
VNWVNVGQPVVVNGNMNTVTLPYNGNMFFRLNYPNAPGLFIGRDRFAPVSPFLSPAFQKP